MRLPPSWEKCEESEREKERESRWEVCVSVEERKIFFFKKERERRKKTDSQQHTTILPNCSELFLLNLRFASVFGVSLYSVSTPTDAEP